jgi:hypothetical protein
VILKTERKVSFFINSKKSVMAFQKIACESVAIILAYELQPDDTDLKSSREVVNAEQTEPSFTRAFSVSVSDLDAGRSSTQDIDAKIKRLEELEARIDAKINY